MDGRQPFDGQVAIVTGAAQGIGLATSELLASRGATVVMTDINADRLADAAAGLSADGQRVTGHTADLTQEDHVASLATATIERHGQIDILVNLAAIYPIIPFDQFTLADWRKVMAANVEATFLCAREVVPHMRSRSYGRIVNTSSGTFDRPEPGMSAYVTSKAAVIGFTRQLAVEAGDGITVNGVMPGLIDTEGVRTMADDTVIAGMFERITAIQAVKRRGQPLDIAQAIAFLASDEASFITGQIFGIGGGVSFN